MFGKTRAIVLPLSLPGRLLGFETPAYPKAPGVPTAPVSGDKASATLRQHSPNRTLALVH